MKKQIKITLRADRCCTIPTYELVKIVNAVTVEYYDPDNIREKRTLRVGYRFNEDVAMALCTNNHEVTII